MEKSAFKTYHPIVNFTYFAVMIGLSCLFMHPVGLTVSFVSAFTYSVMLKGREGVKQNLIYMLPILALTALINPLFNHQGVTVITYLPSGNPLTAESVIYGFSSALMLAGVIGWFSCFNQVMTSDKLICLFGRIIPSLSLIFSMTLRFVPRFSAQLKVVVNAQKALGRDMSSGSIVRRVKNGLNILSSMTTWALENAIDTADSMKSRGFGHKGRTAYSIYKFDKRDGVLMSVIIASGIYVLSGYIFGGISFAYFPQITFSGMTPFSISIFAVYLLLCMSPVIIEIKEVRKWKYLSLKR